MNNSDFMASAYKLIYEIEIGLKGQIRQSMFKAYGKHWKHKINTTERFSSALFHEIIPYFAKYKPLQNIYSEKERKELYALIPIRNKICHMKLLNIEEFNLLTKTHDLVVSRLNTSIRTNVSV